MCLQPSYNYSTLTALYVTSIIQRHAQGWVLFVTDMSSVSTTALTLRDMNLDSQLLSM